MPIWIFLGAAVAQLALIASYVVLRARRSAPEGTGTAAAWPRLGERLPLAHPAAAAAGTLAGALAARPPVDILFLGLGGVLLPTLTAQALTALTRSRRLPVLLALVAGAAAGVTAVP